MNATFTHRLRRAIERRWYPNFRIRRRLPVRTAFASASLIFLVGLIGLSLHEPWLYPSLGPSAYLMIHDPDRPSASFYNTVVGHLTALASGVLAAVLFGLNHAPGIFAPAGHLTPARVAGAGIALGLTFLLAGALRASHPPAGSTAMIVVLGGLRVTAGTILAVTAGVLALAGAGEALRAFGLAGERRRRAS